MDCPHADRDPVLGDGQVIAQVCRGCGEEWPVDLAALASVPLSPAAEADHVLRVRAFLDSLPEGEGTFGGHLVTDVCYQAGGCGPGCPVWVGEAEDARGPN